MDAAEGPLRITQQSQQGVDALGARIDAALAPAGEEHGLDLTQRRSVSIGPVGVGSVGHAAESREPLRSADIR